jgi:hypothetical protein
MDNAGREKIAREFQEERAKQHGIKTANVSVTVIESRKTITPEPTGDQLIELQTAELKLLRIVALTAAKLIPHLDRLGLQTHEYQNMREALLAAALFGGF